MRVGISFLLCITILDPGVSILLARDQFDDFIMSESWGGLDGELLVNGKPTKLPALMWELVTTQKNQRRTLVPIRLSGRHRRRYATQKPPPAEWSVEEEVWLRVRAASVTFTPAPRKSTLKNSEWQGGYLTAPDQPESGSLSLRKQPTAASSWKVRRGHQTIWRKDHGRDGFQFEVTAEVSWQLESIQHPDWFLGRREGQLVLVRDLADAEVVRFGQQRFFDDLSDGK
jgi:hypothetical protein